MSPLVGVLLCLITQALYSGSEMALISCNRLRMRHLMDEGDRRAEWALNLLKRPERLLGTTLVGVNVSVVLGSICMETWITSNPALANYSAIISALIMTPLLLMGGEILPMSFTHQHSSIVARLVALPLQASYFILYPLVWIASRFAGLIGRLLGEKSAGRVFATREELQLMISESMDVPGPASSEPDMFGDVFDFGDTVARNVMIPLIDVIAAPTTATVAEATRFIERTSHSRIPIYENRIDNIVGVVRAVDLVAFPDEEPVRSAMYRPYFIPETKRIEDVLADFRVNQRRMGVVVDEFGGCSGIVTLEDIIEEIVGEITDEYGVGVEAEGRVVGDWIEVEGKMRIDDLNEEFGLDIPEGDYESVAGYVIQRSGRIPRVNERLVIDRRLFRVAEATDRRLEKLSIRRSLISDSGK